MFRGSFCTCAALLVLATTGNVFSQVTGRLSGAVTDAAGAAVPEATVNLSLEGGTKSILTTVTNSEGYFQFASVRPEFYELSVEAKGFKKFVIKQVKVDPAREATVQT